MFTAREMFTAHDNIYHQVKIRYMNIIFLIQCNSLSLDVTGWMKLVRKTNKHKKKAKFVGCGYGMRWKNEHWIHMCMQLVWLLLTIKLNNNYNNTNNNNNK